MHTVLVLHRILVLMSLESVGCTDSLVGKKEGAQELMPTSAPGNQSKPLEVMYYLSDCCLKQMPFLP